MQFKIGEKYLTREGQEVMITDFDGPWPLYPMVGRLTALHNEIFWCKNGRHIDGDTVSELDLVSQVQPLKNKTALLDF